MRLSILLTVLLFLVLSPSVFATRTAADFKGLKQGFLVKYNSDDKITITPGKLHSTTTVPLTHKILELSSEVTTASLSLTASTWHFVYIETPGSGVSCASGDVKVFAEGGSDDPAFNSAKFGWYHPTETDRRCIGAIWVDSDGDIVPFVQTAQRFQLMTTGGPTDDVTVTAVSGSPAPIELDAPSFALESAVIVQHNISSVSSNEGELNYRDPDRSGPGIRIANLDSSARDFRISLLMDIQIAAGTNVEEAHYFVTSMGDAVRVETIVMGYVMPFAIGETAG